MSEELALAREAQLKAERAAAKNVKLKEILAAQQVILSDLNSSLDIEKIETRLEDYTEKDTNLTELITMAQRHLIYLHQKQNTPIVENEDSPNRVIKEIINDVIGQVTSLCMECANTGSYDIPITAVVDLERQLENIEDSLYERGLYHEDEETAEIRNNIKATHMMSVMTFVKQALNRRPSMTSSSSSDDEQ